MNIIQVSSAGAGIQITDGKMLELESFGENTARLEKQATNASLKCTQVKREEIFDEISFKKRGERVTINVSGTRYVTTWRTLAKVPNSRLGKLTVDDIDSGENDIFFERNPTLFPYILSFYSTGELSFPHNICGAAMLKELEFWQISRCALAPCCKEILLQQEAKQQENETLAKAFGLLESQENIRYQTACGRWRAKLRIFLDDPTSSKGARIWLVLYLMCTVLIFTVDAFATVKSLRIPTFNPSIFTSAANLSNKETMYLATSEHILPIALRYATYVYFTLDILLRVISAQSARHYFKSLLNIVDVVWVVVNWSLIAVSNLLGVKWLYMSASEVRVFTGLVMVVMLLRIFRIYRFGQHYIPLRVLLLTMKGSSTEVGLLFLLLCTGAMVFGPLIYVAELGNDNSFMYNILIGYWWAVVTMTTVGYGDIYPVDVPGYFVGILCVIVGLGFISLPMSVISTNFSKYREFARTFGARKRSVDRYLYQSSKVSPFNPAKDDQMAENDEKQTI